MNTKRTCETCRYYDEHYIDPDVGFCRRHTPRLDDYSDQLEGTRGAWPIVESGDWCGEYAPVGELEMQRILEEAKA